MFNLHKYSQTESPFDGLEQTHQTGNLKNIDKQLINNAGDAIDSQKNQGANSTQPLANDQHEQMLVDFNTLKAANDYLTKQGPQGNVAWETLIRGLAAKDIANQSTYFRIADEIQSNPEMSAMNAVALQQAENKVLNGPLGAEIRRLLQTIKSKPQPTQQIRTPVTTKSKFNLKLSQMETGMEMQEQLFPVSSSADLANKFLTRLTSENESIYTQAYNEILDVAGGAEQEEIKSMLDTIKNPETPDENKMQVFVKIYNWLPDFCKSENKMSEAKGIIKFNLSDHILNNKEMTKTADQHFGNSSILYGPTEKRICPKLRGHGVGDVVSEYICRHHCLDGIVIDDNKTVCGEALWRAHAMDKFSREYVDEDGNIVGGYLNKRFEINRNVPEENKMRLKPGETRKPRPPEWGSTESRLQAMRAKEGEARNYRPETNTGDAFDWCSDVDQNNVNVSQEEKDKREKATGHKLVNYKKKEDQENNPKEKTSFNLSKTKIAQLNNMDESGHPEFSLEETMGLKPGTKVVINPTPIGVRDSYPAANWVTHEMTVILKDYAPNQGTVDVIDIILPAGEDNDLSIYDFNIVKTANTSFNLQRKIAQINKEVSPDDLLPDNSPSEEDVLCEDHNGPFRYAGKQIANNILELQDWMTRNQFFPDVWFIDDHGGSLNITKSIWDDGGTTQASCKPCNQVKISKKKRL